MTQEQRIATSLLLLRIGVFVVMFMWTLDKFVRPGHAGAVYETFYGIGGMGPAALYAVAGVEMLILLGFLLGVLKRWTYGAVLLFHGVSTLSSYKQYLAPFSEGPNLLFFAAWPMLAACIALYLLRDLDTRWTLGRNT
ncbi:MAG: hypothetical protein PVF91_11610 [Chromatiales bacterium]|jgi:hypothetical protein